MLHIAVFAPLRSCFDYKPLADQLCQVGMRVKVPFGRTSRIGVILAIDETSNYPFHQLKTIQACLDPTPLLQAIDLKLLHWVIEYYHCNPGDALTTALPKNMRMGKKVLPLTQEKGWCLTALAQDLDFKKITQRAPKQAKILQALSQSPQNNADLKSHCQATSTTLKTLQQKGWIETCQIKQTQENTTAKETPPQLNAEQQQVVESVQACFNLFKVHLLEGITGSGKTEVYLTLIQQALEQQLQVLVLVPEIALTPQLLARFKRRLNTDLAVIHSHLNDTEKEQAWHQCRQAKAQVLIGTRSATFTPLPRLGLIIMDEEHDGSFKQQHGLRYCARNVVIVRARNQQIPILLGTATPALETLHNALNQRYQHLFLNTRAGNATPPDIQLLDIRNAYLEAGLSKPLLKQIESELIQQNQVLIFLNRRGFAPVITCHKCGWVADCQNCDAHLTLHAQDQQLHCHHCGHKQHQILICPDCQSQSIISVGQGTERLETVLKAHFPDHPLVRIDRDTTKRKGDLERLLKTVKTGEKKLIIGTQMLAKGHHFPDVTLVVLVDIDQGLFGVDYCATELMAQLITQVAGRAGRAEKKGRVVIQTRHPDHPLLLDLIQNGYASCAKKMLIERREAELPPYTYQALIQVDAKISTLAHQLLQDIVNKAEEYTTPVDLLGPIEAPMHKKATQYRVQLLLQCSQRKALHQLLHQLIFWLEQYPPAKKLRWFLDIDPKSLS